MAYCRKCKKYIETPHDGLCTQCAFKQYSIQCCLCENPRIRKYKYLCRSCYNKYSSLFDTTNLTKAKEGLCSPDIFCKDCDLCKVNDMYDRHRFCYNCLHKIFNNKCAYFKEAPLEDKNYYYICESCYRKILPNTDKFIAVEEDL